MNASDLATTMLEWEQVQRRADELKARIEEAVLQIGKTQTVGNVWATYSAGRKSYYYEKAWQDKYDCPPSEVYQKVAYDYKAAAQDAGIVDIPYAQSGPSVSVKLLKAQP